MPCRNQFDSDAEFQKALRDYFAAKMAMGMVANPDLLKVVTADQALGSEYAQRMATVSYRWADAMLKAREA